MVLKLVCAHHCSLTVSWTTKQHFPVTLVREVVVLATVVVFSEGLPVEDEEETAVVVVFELGGSCMPTISLEVEEVVAAEDEKGFDVDVKLLGEDDGEEDDEELEEDVVETVEEFVTTSTFSTCFVIL